MGLVFTHERFTAFFSDGRLDRIRSARGGRRYEEWEIAFTTIVLLFANRLRGCNSRHPRADGTVWLRSLASIDIIGLT